MSILVIMIPIALGLGGLFTYFFIKAVLSGQYDDLDTPAIKVLMKEGE